MPCVKTAEVKARERRELWQRLLQRLRLSLMALGRGAQGRSHESLLPFQFSYQLWGSRVPLCGCCKSEEKFSAPTPVVGAVSAANFSPHTLWGKLAEPR